MSVTHFPLLRTSNATDASIVPAVIGIHHVLRAYHRHLKAADFRYLDTYFARENPLCSRTNISRHSRLLRLRRLSFFLS